MGLLLVGLPALGQEASGTISGTVQDPQRAVIPGAKVTLINQAQGAVSREVATGSQGSFVLTPVLPGTYTVTVECAGFKTYSQRDIVVYTSDRVGLPPITMELGSVGESVTVEASAVSLQTVSAERSGVITSKQVGELGMVSRNFIDLLKTVPGAQGQNSNGARTDQNNYTVDGVSVNDTGCNCTGGWRVNTDIIEEFKVLTTGQQAEFGRAAGSNVIVTTKSGTQGFNVGGPIYIPGKFNTDKDKLFFFTNMEIQRPRSPSGWNNRTYPTAAERMGDFSKTHESSSLTAIVKIQDPANNKAQFPGNQIPQSRFNPLGKAAAYNPVTGKYAPSVLIGSLVPGVGNMDNGIVTAGTPGYTRGLIDSRGVQVSPRFGLAWTPARPNGKTVLRVGGGVFKERIQGNMIFYQLSNPPGNRQPRFYYGNLSTLTSIERTDFPVSNLYGMSRDGHIPTVYSFSFTVQRELPYNVLFDIGYVGTLSRHILAPLPINNVPFGSAWLPQFQDPTVTPKYDGSTTLAADFARPFQGFGGNTYYTYGSSSNYNSLQMSANRRMGKDLTFGVAYTWSKALGVSQSMWDGLHPTNVREADYGLLQYDRKHNLVVNWIYGVPNPIPEQSSMNNAVTRGILSGWQVSGIYTLQTGGPTNVGYSIQGESNLNNKITGSSTWGPRVVVNGVSQPAGSGSDQYKMFDTSVFAPAVKGSIGIDSGPVHLYNPGANNWDISMFKNYQLGSNERRYLQFRIETYNTFNHKQWSGFGRSATFNSAGALTNLPTPPGAGGTGRFGFGATSGARTERRDQMAARIYF